MSSMQCHKPADKTCHQGSDGHHSSLGQTHHMGHEMAKPMTASSHDMAGHGKTEKKKKEKKEKKEKEENKSCGEHKKKEKSAQKMKCKDGKDGHSSGSHNSHSDSGSDKESCKKK